VTVICPLAESHVTGFACEAGAAAELAASRKEEKYASIGSEYHFAPIAVETLGPMKTSACQLFANLGRMISSMSGDDREGAFLFCGEFWCWCSATTLSCYMTPCQPLTARTDDLYQIVYYVNFKTPSGTYLMRVKNNITTIVLSHCGCHYTEFSRSH